jgi:hypothetical protein
VQELTQIMKQKMDYKIDITKVELCTRQNPQRHTLLAKYYTNTATNQ